jgi:hypothetical protein
VELINRFGQMCSRYKVHVMLFQLKSTLLIRLHRSMGINVPQKRKFAHVMRDHKFISEHCKMVR